MHGEGCVYSKTMICSRRMCVSREALEHAMAEIVSENNRYYRLTRSISKRKEKKKKRKEKYIRTPRFVDTLIGSDRLSGGLVEGEDQAECFKPARLTT